MFNKWADNFVELNKDNKKTKGYSIEIDGIPFKSSRGKTVWARVGHAKNALRNALGYTNSLYNTKVRDIDMKDWREADVIVEEAYQKFLKERVTFKELN